MLLKVAAARGVAANTGTVTNLFTLKEAHWDAWRRGIEQSGNTGVIQWVGWVDEWLSTVAQNAPSLITGAGVNAFSCTRIKSQEAVNHNWIAELVQTLDLGWMGSPLLRSTWRAGLSQAIEDGHEEMLEGLAFAFPHHRMMEVNFLGRQKRTTAVQAQWIGNHMTPIMFLFAKDLVDFYVNLPIDDLRYARLYRAYARSRFSNLFPQGEESFSPAMRLVRRGGRFLGRMIGTRVKPKVINPINHARIVVPNKTRILELAKIVQPIIDPVLDVSNFCREVQRFGEEQTISSYQIIRAVNLFFLLQLTN